MPADRPRKSTLPGAGVYRGKVPSVTEIQADSEPPSGSDLLDADEAESDTGLKAADSLVTRLAEKSRENHELREQLAQLQATVADLVRRSERPPAPRSDTDGVEVSVKTRGVNWKVVAAALPGLIAGVGWGVDKYNSSNAPKAVPVAPVANDVSELATRVGRIESCLAARAKAEQADEDFVEKALELAGVRLPRRPGDEPPRVIDVETQPLVSGQRGARPLYRITSTRPARPSCQ